MKSIRQLAKFLEEPDDTFGDIEDVDDLEAEEATELYQAVTGMKLRCEKLQDALKVKMPGFGG